VNRSGYLPIVGWLYDASNKMLQQIQNIYILFTKIASVIKMEALSAKKREKVVAVVRFFNRALILGDSSQKKARWP
jgi:hypothetical protein